MALSQTTRLTGKIDRDRSNTSEPYEVKLLGEEVRYRTSLLMAVAIAGPVNPPWSPGGFVSTRYCGSPNTIEHGHGAR
jgi:hypothetical protein